MSWYQQHGNRILQVLCDTVPDPAQKRILLGMVQWGRENDLYLEELTQVGYVGNHFSLQFSLMMSKNV